ncbi:MAG: type II toxin-antitoxin system VapC family toxin [Deltaproteobacteria bacterium]|nr:type II toxin-antitoxin system VapC family toxin [Deltaproteobacteria bacterium]
MLLPDVNILVYAHRADEDFHEPYRAWLEQLASGRAPFALSVLVAAAFVRIVTHRRIYPDPSPLPVALGALEALAGRRNCRLVGPGPDHWREFTALCREVGARGKLVADAQHAAVTIEHGCTLVTRDGDFARFERAGLRWQHLVLEH